MLQPRSIQSSLGLRDKIFSFDYILIISIDISISVGSNDEISSSVFILRNVDNSSKFLALG